MAFGSVPRYCCTNVAGRCPHALSDVLFSRAQFEQWQGRCGTTDTATGCGRPLAPGKPADRRVPWLLGTAIVAAVLATSAWWLRNEVFPPPIAGIDFALAQTRVSDRAQQVEVELVRNDAADPRVTVVAEVTEATAVAGTDFVAPARSIEFAPGERRKRIAIALLADKTFQRPERFLRLTLVNVKNRPSHTVVIAPDPGDPDKARQIEQMVLTASRIAADIAGFVVKREVLEGLLRDSRAAEPEFDEYRKQLRDTTDNLIRAREAYMQALRSLQTAPPQTVLTTIDRLVGELRGKDFRQQAGVLPPLGRQFRELANGKGPDMDRWVIELGASIPRVKTPAGAAKTV